MTSRDSGLACRTSSLSTFRRFLAVAACVGLVSIAANCGKKTAPEVSVASLLSSADPEAESLGPSNPMDPGEAALWAAAKDGEAEDLMRLGDRVGCTGLRERATVSELRLTAVRAMEFCGDLSELEWLAEIAAMASDDVAQAALDSIDAIAALPRRPVDPEDAEDLRAGCERLMKLARSAGAAKNRRIEAVRALRMLSDRGCVRRADIPSDVDTH
ncbi:MAG: hypothetical protein ABTD50_08410 [Polyangiaceae bacterium]|jgi:hypothetical protein